MNIKTVYEYPPIPVPGFWIAYDDNLGADTSPCGQRAEAHLRSPRNWAA